MCNQTLLLQELLQTSNAIGITATIEALRSIRTTVQKDKIVNFMLDLCSNEFKLSKDDIIFSNAKTDARKFALMFLAYHLNKTFYMPIRHINIYALPKKSKSQIERYIIAYKQTDFNKLKTSYDKKLREHYLNIQAQITAYQDGNQQKRNSTEQQC